MALAKRGKEKGEKMIQTLEYDLRGTLRIPTEENSQHTSGILKNIDKEYIHFSSSQEVFGLSIFTFTPQKGTIVKEEMAESDFCMLSFCLGEALEWSLSEAPGKLFHIEGNESCIINGGTDQCISRYERGQRYNGLGISFNPSKMRSVAACLECESAINSHRSLSSRGLKRYTLTPGVLAILSQITGCTICGRLKDLYLEAKLLELIAVYLDEMVCQRREKLPELSLSKDDIAALDRARDIMDKTFVHPLTLTKLARKVYLNEYKLKTGFKQRFGQTVYGYVLDKRMELAHILIEQQRFRVSDIAGMVGYTNTSHFIAAFTRKYGITPGKFRKYSEKQQLYPGFSETS